MSCNAAANAWANAVDLGLPGLPAFDPTGLPPSSLPPVDPDTNIQDRPRFETEAALITSLATSLIRITPSRAEAEPTPTDAVVLSASDLPEILETKLPPGGRGRGLVLHTLMEEALTGEAADDAAELTKRAGELLATCEMDTAGNDPTELAATVLRTLALPEIVDLRPRLVPELRGAREAAVEGEEQVVSGISDAVAHAPDGNIEVVVDWKSDVAPAAQTVDGYRSQVSAYIRATGAPRGLIVLMTSATVLKVVE